MQKVSSSLDKMLSVLAFLFSVSFVVVVIIQIFSRTFLPKTPAWTEELARYSFIYAIAFAGGLAVRANAYVSVDIFTSMLPEKLVKFHVIAIDAFMMLFCGFFLYKSVFKFAFLKQRLVSTALEIPMQVIYFAMVLLFGLMAICYLLEILLIVTGQKQAREGSSAL